MKYTLIERCFDCNYRSTIYNGLRNFTNCTHPDIEGSSVISVTGLVSEPKSVLKNCPLPDFDDCKCG